MLGINVSAVYTSITYDTMAVLAFKGFDNQPAVFFC